MDKIEVGDFVIAKESLARVVMGNSDIYIISGVNDNSYLSEKGVYIENITYELMRVLPINKYSEISNANSLLVSLYQKKGMALYNQFIYNLTNKRKDMGFEEKADFEYAIENNDTKDVKYSKLETVDECLDTMNFLDEMFNLFGDETYKKKRMLVERRLKAILKRKVNNKEVS